MKTKTLGITLIIIGIIIISYTGFNYVTTEKVIDLGPVEINKEVNHHVKWSPIIGIALLVGGVVVIVNTKKNSV